MVDFGLKLDIDLPFDGKWESNEYSGNGFNGGWYNNATMLDFFTVMSMNSEWEVVPSTRIGGGGFIGYWFNRSVGLRFDLDYMAGSVETKADMRYHLWDALTDDEYLIDVDYDPVEGSSNFSTFKIAPTLQFSFGDNPHFGSGLLIGPAVFIDNYEVYLDVPIVVTSDNQINEYYSNAGYNRYVYSENATAFGITAGLTGRFPLSPSVFIEGVLSLDLGAMPIYDAVEDYGFLDEPILRIENKSGFLRSVGLQLGIGFNLAPVEYADSDGDGVWDPWDMCPDTPPGTLVDERGCPRRERRPIQDVDVEQDFVDKGVFITNEIFFEFNSDEITPDSYLLLDKIGEVLEKHPGWVIEIAGHTDSIGTESYNQKLSERRAKAVKDYIAANFNVIPANLSAQGYGESMPIADNGTQEGRAKNRRVEFKKIR
jgi:outer membrane protein OmpA-like peptidoglycan-associated protein